MYTVPDRKDMANLSSLPTEVFNEIVRHLPRRSQLLLRQCSRTLEDKSDRDMLFRTQRFYHSIVDFQNLVAFSIDSAHENARLRCKTLVIDTFSPCSMKIRCKVQPEGEGERTTKTIKITTPKLENEQIIKLLTTALDSLPNLECIEFTTTADVGDVPNTILHAHYPTLKFDIREKKAGKWFKAAYRNGIQYANLSEFGDATFANTMEAISRSTWRPKMIRYPELTDMKRWAWKAQHSEVLNNGPPIRWFRDLEMMARLRPKLQNLRKLEILVRVTESEDWDPDELFQDLEGTRPGVTRFLEAVPNVEELRFKVGGCTRLNIVDSLGRWLPRQFPTNPVDVGSLKFNNLRILSLVDQAFVESELKTFLTSHRDTLRKVELINCVLHSGHQIWSGIFNLLRTDLWLWSFEFHIEYPKIYYDTTEHLRIVPWFRVYGNARTSDHRCELLPKDDLYKRDNRHRIDFDQAMQVVSVLENKVVLEDNPELNAEKQDILNRLKLVRQGISPDNPGVPLQAYLKRMMVQQLSYRQFLMKFHGIQPGDVKSELAALGVKGFETEDKGRQFDQLNSCSAVSAAAHGSESYYKHITENTV
ncbi:hypothetical protein TWF718_008229 [Orbilia javanica]|uniref:F-box domain-containing protein n=1 Tax=Orbilia javanica TaxID=47235 RepID=A0AAN8MQ06_9PEZI